jgi:hypothetical protein
MVENSRCSVYGNVDSWKHSLLECHMANAVWALKKGEITEALCMINEGATKAWLSTMWKTLSHDVITRVVVRLWAIWRAR